MPEAPSRYTEDEQEHEQEEIVKTAEEQDQEKESAKDEEEQQQEQVEKGGSEDDPLNTTDGDLDSEALRVLADNPTYNKINRGKKYIFQKIQKMQQT